MERDRVVRAIEWAEGSPPGIRILDQTLLPGREQSIVLQDVDALVEAIQSLAVRGAPALGAAGGLGVVLALVQGAREKWSEEELLRQIERVRSARPTAVNLAWGVDRVEAVRKQGLEAALAEAKAIIAEDEGANRELSRLGADWLLQQTGKDRLRIITHCNTGALATAAWGTAYGIIHELHQRGRLELVYVDETRPLLQGSRLTSWELTKDEIPHLVQVDGAASSTILRGLADAAIIGADRIAANGDTANKIGSVALSLAAERANIPFVVAAPYSTVDIAVETGDVIEIEERAAQEVAQFAGASVVPEGAAVFNPAFDVTPHDLISAVVTERGVIEPMKGEDMQHLAH